MRGLANDMTWDGEAYPADQYRADATLLDGVDVIGDGAVADMLWSRYAVNVLGIDCPPVVGATAAVQPEARAAVSLRVPPGEDAEAAQGAHRPPRGRGPVAREVEITPGQGARAVPRAQTTARPSGPCRDALSEAYGKTRPHRRAGRLDPAVHVLQNAMPEAEILMYGVEEPRCLIHAPNESVDPSEIEHMALAEALFLRELGNGG